MKDGVIDRELRRGEMKKTACSSLVDKNGDSHRRKKRPGCTYQHVKKRWIARGEDTEPICGRRKCSRFDKDDLIEDACKIQKKKGSACRKKKGRRSVGMQKKRGGRGSHRTEA